MRRNAKILCTLALIVLISSYAAAVQTQAAQQKDTVQQLQIGAQDVITASDGGGGYLSTGDILLVIIIVFAVIGAIAVL